MRGADYKRAYGFFLVTLSAPFFWIVAALVIRRRGRSRGLPADLDPGVIGQIGVLLAIGVILSALGLALLRRPKG